MHEFELIDHYFRRSGGRGVVLGIGDDGAILDVPPGRQLIAVVDTLVEGVHFPPELDARDIGYRAVAVNLSDIAAMGGEPAWMTLALTLPEADTSWLAGFAEGLFIAAAEHDVALVGGDTTAGGETVISVQLLGHIASGQFLTRSGCRPGDSIYVSGTPGDAAAGLALLQQGNSEHALAKRFCRPAARVQLGQAVANLASAAIDVSDGLCADLQRLLQASGCGATIEQQRLPLSPALLDHCGDADAARLALTGGDDYELLLTVNAEQEAEFLQAARKCDVSVTRLGVAEIDMGLRVTRNGQPITMNLAGYRHFS
ncbi:MAG: thiamine-phosphate kinase [Woeseia sp.]